jgi:hypothetical protein
MYYVRSEASYALSVNYKFDRNLGKLIGNPSFEPVDYGRGTTMGRVSGKWELDLIVLQK